MFPSESRIRLPTGTLPFSPEKLKSTVSLIAAEAVTDNKVKTSRVGLIEGLTFLSALAGDGGAEPHESYIAAHAGANPKIRASVDPLPGTS
jgi:hypothetical protein